jgi:hypothetical protein
MSSDGFQNLQNKFLFNLRRHSTLHDLPFQSYDQSKMSKNVTVWHSDPSVTWTSRGAKFLSWIFLLYIAKIELTNERTKWNEDIFNKVKARSSKQNLFI